MSLFTTGTTGLCTAAGRADATARAAPVTPAVPFAPGRPVAATTGPTRALRGSTPAVVRTPADCLPAAGPADARRCAPISASAALGFSALAGAPWAGIDSATAAMGVAVCVVAAAVGEVTDVRRTDTVAAPNTLGLRADTGCCRSGRSAPA